MKRFWKFWAPCLVVVLLSSSASARWLTTMPPAWQVEPPRSGTTVADSNDRLRRLTAVLIVESSRLEQARFDPKLRRLLGALLLRTARQSEDAQKYREAETQFRAAVGLDTGDWPARVGLARALAGRFRLGEALVQAREAAVYSDRPSAVVELIGDLHFELGNLLEAESAYRRLLDAGHSLGSLARMALVYEARGRDERAETMLGQACEAGRRDKTPVPDIVWCVVARGDLALARGRLYQAAGRFAHALTIDPSSADAAWGKARVAFRRGKRKAAEHDLRALVEQHPRPRYLQTLAAVLEGSGEKEAAASARKRARQELAADVAAGNLAALGPYAESLSLPDGDARLAVQAARRQIDDLRHDAEAYATLAWALRRDRRFDDAVAAIERALASGSSNPALLARAGLVYAAADRSSQAYNTLTRALTVPMALPPALARQARDRRTQLEAHATRPPPS